MKKIYLMTALAVAACSATISARQLTPAEALAAVASRSGVHRVAATVVPTPVYTATAEGLKTLYVFSGDDGSGYIVAAADDVATPLTGYSDTGCFDPDNIPPALAWWLDCYSAEIARAAKAAGGESGKVYQARNSSARTEVSPLTHTLWNQDAPYNDLCPELTSSTGTTERSVTGCVATAMAQVMKVHAWPSTGKGSKSYTFTYEENQYQESMDFASTTFDWSNMVNDYAGNTTTSAQDEAVATLMKACGVGTAMSYGLAATGGSGTSSFDAATGLVNYFDYDKGLRYLSRSYYSYDEWVDIVYAEVAAGRPVLYGGESSEGGHEFVCDGYSSGDYFHFNWGWGGMSDGYFLLSALDPADQGIGGSDSGYNMNQDIIVGIQPPVAGSTVVPSMVMEGTFTTGQQSYQAGADVTFGEEGSTAFSSISIANIAVTLGVKLTSGSGEPVYVASSTATASALPPQEGWEEFAVSSADFPEGTFTVTPAFLSGGEWHDVLTPENTPGYLTATNDGSTITFTTPSDTPALTVTGCTQVTELYIGQPAEFAVTVSATGNFYGEVLPALVSEGSVFATGTPKGLTYEAGQTDEIDWVMEFAVTEEMEEYGYSLTAGDYSLVFISPEGTAYSSEYAVTLNAEQSVTPEVSVSGITFKGSRSGSGFSDDPCEIDPSDLSVSLTITGVTGYWADNVTGMFFDIATSREVDSFGSEFVGVDSGNSHEVTLTGSVTGLAADETYLFLPWGTNTHQFTNDFTYVRASTTGVEKVAAAVGTAIVPAPGERAIVVTGAAEGTVITVYSTTGMMMTRIACGTGGYTRLGTLAPGDYIVRADGRNGVATAHILLK